jgi:hypothetical protein
MQDNLPSAGPPKPSLEHETRLTQERKLDVGRSGVLTGVPHLTYAPPSTQLPTAVAGGWDTCRRVRRGLFGAGRADRFN